MSAPFVSGWRISRAEFPQFALVEQTPYWSERAGVYALINRETGMAEYVGKAASLRRRASEHFRSRDSQPIHRRIADVGFPSFAMVALYHERRKRSDERGYDAQQRRLMAEETALLTRFGDCLYNSHSVGIADNSSIAERREAAQRAALATDAVREKLIAANARPEVRSARRAAARASWSGEATLAKRAASEEARAANISAAQTEWAKTPERLAQLSAAAKASWAPGAREKQLAAKRAFYADPVKKAAWLAKVREAAARRAAAKAEAAA